MTVLMAVRDPTPKSARPQNPHQACREHQVFNYRELWDQVAFTDEDPGNPGHVRLFYTGWTREAGDHGNGQSQWNREHVWAKSRGDFGTRPGAGTDLHLIRATDVSVNNRRGNLAFDEGGEPVIDNDGPTACFKDSDSWEPRDQVKGDVARMLFYAAVRYESVELDLELIDDTVPKGDHDPEHGVLSTLLQWHVLDPVDADERFRHERIATRQGNRNPFIDLPDLVALVWNEVNHPSQ